MSSTRLFIRSVVSSSILMSIVGLTAFANAEGKETPAETGKATMPVEGQDTPPEALPPPKSSHDEKPMVAAPTVGATGVTTQAGIGGTQAYGRSGVLETGGALGFTAASGYTAFRVNPFLGFFISDNFELSLIARFQYAKVTTTIPALTPGGKATDVSNSSTEGTFLIEPSYHLPFTQTLFAFLGLGAGVQGSTGASTGFALSPRVGLNVLVGRSGVFTPDLTFTYSTSKAEAGPNGTTVAVLQSSFGINAGFSVMW